MTKDREYGDMSKQLHAFGEIGGEDIPVVDLERSSEEGIVSSGHSGDSYHVSFHYEIPETKRIEQGREGLSREEYDQIVSMRDEHGIVGVRLPSRVIYIEDPRKLLEDEDGKNR